MHQTQNQELWVQLEEYPNYAVSDHGRVKNIKRNKFIGHDSGLDYIRVRLYKKGRKTWASVHRLVAVCFIPNLESKPVVNHINGCKHDNRVTNLEWCTPSENSQHAYALGLSKKSFR